MIDNLLWAKWWVLTSFYQKQDFAYILGITKIDKVTTSNPIDLFNVYSCVKATKYLDGDIAEVGVYKGGSAKVITLSEKRRHIHLFDTFEGLPEVSKHDTKQLGGTFCKGDFKSSFEVVNEYLKQHNVTLYKGLFPKTAEPIKYKKFSFVYLDVDIYSSTKDALEFFLPRMVKGGIILSHDYPNSHGVKKAFDEFYKGTKLELMDKQVVIIK